MEEIASTQITQTAVYQCRAPPSSEIQTVQIGLSFNGRDLLSQTLRFEYNDHVHLTALSPSGGIAEGGTRVFAHGTGFSERASVLGDHLCRFNLTRAPTLFINSQEISCVSPPHTIGAVNFEVALNDQQACS